MFDTRLEQFEGFRYLVFETLRRSGAPVASPMCYIVEDNVVYLRTNQASAKVKRLRRDTRVRLAPGDAGGKRLGEWVEGRATIYGAGELPWVYERFRQKYRWEQRIIDLIVRWKKLTYIVLAVELTPEAATTPTAARVGALV